MKQNQPSPTHLKARNHVSCLMPQTLSLLWKGISFLVSALVALFSTTRSQTLYQALGRLTILCVLVNIDHFDQLNAATSTPPNRMAFQSYLTDGDGDPIAANSSQNKIINFIIYGSENDDDAKYKEQQVVTVNDGHFSVILGEGERIPDSSGEMLLFKDVFSGTDASDRFIELTIVNESGGSDQVLLPRLRLLPSPYAFMASKVASLDLTDTDVLEGQLGGGNIADDAIGSIKIADESITSADIKNGAVTSSDIASNTIVSANIKDGTVTSDDIANSTIVSADIKDGAVTSSDIANSTIVSADIKDNTVTSEDLGNNTFISSSSAKLRIVRGLVQPNGEKWKGEGWSSKRDDEGRYTITFSPPFTSYPIVSVTPYEEAGQDDNACNTGVLRYNYFKVYIMDNSPDTNAKYEDGGFSFIAIGD